MQRRLFLDDTGIALMTNLTRTMHQPAKKGAVIRPNVDHGELVLQTRSAPAWDPQAGVFKLWMLTSAPHSGTTYAESKDGLHWQKPALRQQEVDGTHENNYVALGPGLEWPANAIENAVYDPDDPDPSRRFKGFAHCFTREPIVSPDGIRWRRLDAPPIPSEDESNLSHDRQAHVFIATVKHGGPHGRSVYLTTSPDFERWSSQELIFHADDLDQTLGRAAIERRFADPLLDPPVFDMPAAYNVDVYNMGVFRYEGMYIGLPSMYHKTGEVKGDWPGFADWDVPPQAMAAYRKDGDWCGFHHVQLACSRDLRSWQRLGERRPFIDCSPLGSGAYDLATVIGPSSPVARGNELWFYYTGIKKYGGPTPAHGPERDQGAICLAVLRRDGFVSLDAGEREGVLVTEPFAWSGRSLHVNVDAVGGSFRAELLDQRGSLIAVSEELHEDSVDAELRWKADISTGSRAGARGKSLRLRLVLRKASCYSYWVEEW